MRAPGKGNGYRLFDDIVSDDLDAQLRRLAELTDGCIREAVAQHVSPRAQRLGAMLDYQIGVLR